MNLESRVEKLEALLLPKPDYRPEIYDFLIQAEVATAARTEAEAVRKYGNQETWLNDQRVD